MEGFNYIYIARLISSQHFFIIKHPKDPTSHPNRLNLTTHKHSLDQTKNRSHKTVRINSHQNNYNFNVERLTVSCPKVNIQIKIPTFMIWLGMGHLHSPCCLDLARRCKFWGIYLNFCSFFLPRIELNYFFYLKKYWKLCQYLTYLDKIFNLKYSTQLVINFFMTVKFVSPNLVCIWQFPYKKCYVKLPSIINNCLHVDTKLSTFCFDLSQSAIFFFKYLLNLYSLNLHANVHCLDVMQFLW
jgi:hypothetical protein